LSKVVSRVQSFKKAKALVRQSLPPQFSGGDEIKGFGFYHLELSD